MEAVVNVPFVATKDRELTLTPGDVITRIIQIDETWWEGQLNGQRGYFKENFVKFTPKENILDQEHKMGRRETKKKHFVRALHNYVPENDDELLLKVNDVIEVIEETEEGWWKGILKGNIGMFPSNFVSLHVADSLETDVKEKHENSFEMPHKENSTEFTEVTSPEGNGTKVKQTIQQTAVLAPVLTNDASDRLKTENNSAAKKGAGAPKKPPPPTPTDISAPRLPPKPVKEQARVLFPYEAQNEDELTINEGDIINVISKEIEDKGWWKGELNNQIGVFPDNFVKLIKVEEPAQRKPDHPEKPLVIVSTKPNFKPEHYEKGSSSSSPSLDKRLSKIPPAKPPPPDIFKKEEKPERPVPPQPGKKPQLPPPMKKPVRSSMCPKTTGNAETNCISAADNSFCGSVTSPALPSPNANDGLHKTELIEDSSHNAIFNERPESVFDAVETSVDRLVHLIATRVKGPNRRPPSHSFLKENDKESAIFGDTQWIKHVPMTQVKSCSADKVQELNTMVVSPSTDDKPKISPFRPAPPSTKTTTPKLSKQDVSSHSISVVSHTANQIILSSPPNAIDSEERYTVNTSIDISKEPNPLQEEISQMKNELNFLKGSMVSRNEYEILLKQVIELKENMEVQKNNCNKLLSSLKAELEEEKKLRIATQKELEQIKMSAT